MGLAIQLLTIALQPPIWLSTAAWQTVGLAAMMAIFWVMGALPLAVTALLPLIVAPLMGIAPIGEIGADYGHPIIFLFFGGFVLGLAMERWQLHRRLALQLLVLFGQSPKKQLAAFMLATALLSMWVSNTATAIMLLPIALSILSERDAAQCQGFDKALLLGIAYSASIGGIATLIGTPPNALMAAYLQDHHGLTLGFVNWMAMALPLSLLLLALTWLWLSRSLAQTPAAARQAGRSTTLHDELERLGPMGKAEARVALVFLLTAFLWVFRPLINEYLPGGRLSDTAIALAAAVALHILPSGTESGRPLMQWSDTQRLPWGVLLLFGGGLALAGLMQSSGLAQALADLLQLAERWPAALLVVLVVGLIIFLTEVTSNTATTAVFLPLMGVLALAMGLPPQGLVIPAALAASCAFMLPVATPPNAIVFGADKITVADMARAGFVINLLAWLCISALGIWLL